jgi:hypothetical protein
MRVSGFWRRARREFAVCAAPLAFVACSLESPDQSLSGGPASPTQPAPPGTTLGGPTGVPGAPSLVSPPPGAEVADAQPILTVANVTASPGNEVTYTFQISSSAAFSDSIDQVENHPAGSEGTTSWRVSVPLTDRQYFWRARARIGTSTGPFSAARDFLVRSSGGAPPGAPPAAGVLVSDPLTNGSRASQVHGGVFTSSGWRVTSKADYIRYEVPPIEKGYVEWDNRGFTPTNRDPGGYMLFGMWDPSRGDYRENPFRVHLQKLDPNHNRPYVRLRWIANGEEHNTGFNFIDWRPDRVYHWRVDWGPEGDSHRANVSLDGVVVITQRYGRPYRPSVHFIELGVSNRGETCLDAVFSNLRIGVQ